MKIHRFLLFTSLLAAMLPLWQGPVAAQAPTGKRAIAREEVHLYQWPRFARTDKVNNAEVPTRYAQVMVLQYLLRNRGFFSTTPDGDFGTGTERAVKRFQKAHKIVADGVIGEQTLARLIVRLRRGDRGHAVRALQLLLAAVGDNADEMNIDGIFGGETEDTLSFFQQRAGITADGIAGPQTWSALLRARFGEYAVE